jgi:hypothetical protein
MKKRSRVRRPVRILSAFLVGAALFGASGCAGDTDQVEQVQGAITGGWTNLVLKNGWQNYWGTVNPPAVALLSNGTVVFRGALKASNPTSNVAFYLPAAFQPLGNDAGALNLRVVLNNGVGGTLTFRNDDGAVTIGEDGLNPAGFGANAKTLTSLDGVSFDQYVGTILTPANDWEGNYPYREDDQVHGAFVKSVSGFVRFQGLLKRPGSMNQDGYLFTIPSQYRPGYTVVVPADLAGNSTLESWGEIAIYPTGQVYAGPNPNAVNDTTSLEGVSYSLTNSGNINLPLTNGWHAYSARTVKVGNNNGFIQFQGAIAGGTSTTLATLPTGYRPAKTVYLVGAANGPVPARIMVDPSGNVTFDSVPLSVAAVMLSLDGVSFGI